MFIETIELNDLLHLWKQLFKCDLRATHPLADKPLWIYLSGILTFGLCIRIWKRMLKPLGIVVLIIHWYCPAFVYPIDWFMLLLDSLRCQIGIEIVRIKVILRLFIVWDETLISNRKRWHLLGIWQFLCQKILHVAIRRWRWDLTVLVLWRFLYSLERWRGEWCVVRFWRLRYWLNWWLWSLLIGLLWSNMKKLWFLVCLLWLSWLVDNRRRLKGLLNGWWWVSAWNSAWRFWNLCCA